MGYAQWNKNVTASGTSSLELAAPIVGVSSVSLDSNASSQAIYLTPSGVSGFTKGIEQGRLRTLINMKTGTGNGCGFGLVVMASAENIPTVAGAYYRYELFSDSNYSLARSNSSVLTTASPGTTLGSFATTINQNVVYAMEIEWIVDVANLGGVYLITKKGTATDFSGMTILTQIVDTSAQKLLTGNSEGIYMRGYTSVGPVKVLFDQTELFQLV